MELTRLNLRIFTFILGPIILATYAYGVSKMSNPEKLWGGIPESWRKFNVTCMFISAAGFLIMWWMFLFQWENQSVDTFLGHGNQILKGGIIDYSFVLVW